LFALTVQTIEKRMETALQARINPRHGDLFLVFREAGDTKLGDAARDDAAEMLQIRSDVQREAVKRHPALHSHPEGPDFLLRGALADPNADATFSPVRRDPELSERVDHPSFERVDKASDVLSAAVEVEHHIDDALARPVIGITAAAAGLVNRKA